MKKILFVDEHYLVESLTPMMADWGYSVIGISKADFIEEVVIRNEIQLVILTKEMRISGPSLTESTAQRPDLPLEAHFLKLYDTVVDFEWGVRLAKKLKDKGIDLPTICLTTDDTLSDMKWCYCISGFLYSAAISKFDANFHANLKTAIDTLLEHN